MLGIGTNGYVLTSNGSVPTWAVSGSSGSYVSTTTSGAQYVVSPLTISSYTVINTTGVSSQKFTVASDYRIKQDVQTLNDTYTVDKLRPVSYYNTLTEQPDIGLIAHELQDVYPFMVTGEKDGKNNQAVNYLALIGILIKEIQGLKERVHILETNNK